MALFRNIEDTICAIATPQGTGGISVIRISGDKALEITRFFCAFVPEKPESHKIYYGTLKKDNRDIDEVLVSYFKKGKSFTNQETCEISCHGSPAVTKEILNIFIQGGARLAERGEFTYRAFMSGRMDLIQAESVLSLIQSESQKAYQMSLRQLKGDLSNKIKSLENRVTFVLANLEASIDFINEGLDVLDLKKIKVEIENTLNEVEKLTASYQGAKFLNSGAKVVIVGEPNVGKSSLLNRFLGYEKALVSDVPGTTRDVVEGSISVNGLKVTFYDTAGVHETNEKIEQLGISKTLNEITEADLVVYVVDMSARPPHIKPEILSLLEDKCVLFLANKKDLSNEVNFKTSLINQIKEISPKFATDPNMDLIEVSASSGEGIDKFFASLDTYFERAFLENSQVVIQSRHYELLKKIQESLKITLQQIESGSPDIISFSLREAFESFQELLGNKVDDQIMDRVFKEFCIGK